METFLLSGSDGPLTADTRPDVTLIAEKLAGAGLEVVRLADLEGAAIVNALRRCNGNRTYAARQLGMSVRTLQRKLKSAPLGMVIPPH